MRIPILSPIALSLGLMFAAHGAQAQTGEVMTTAPAFEGASCASVDNCFKKRWIYVYANVGRYQGLADPYYKKLSELIANAKTLGYTGIAVDAGGSGSFQSMLVDPPYYKYFYENYNLLVQQAKEAGVDLIPVGGRPEAVAYRHPDLIEAIPVDQSKFTVKSATARIDDAQIVSDTGFELGSPEWHRLESSMQIDPTGGRPDPSNPSNTKALRIDAVAGASGTSRLLRYFNGLKPHTAYRVSFWVKKQNFGTPLLIQFWDPAGKTSIYRNYSSNLGWGTDSNGDWNKKGNEQADTQDWTRYTLDLNTLNNNGFRLYFGTWEAQMKTTGSAWLDDIEIREIGLPHPVRRASLPVTVTSTDGLTTYKEGDDYVVKPERLEIVPTGRIHDNDKLLVSSYQSGLNFSGQSVPASSCSTTFFDEQKAIYEKVNTLFNTPSKFFIYFDEWRVMNWDPSCKDGSAGAYLARTTSAMQDTLRSVNPKLDLYIWNDMFDPNVNAVPVYFTVNGDLTGSWNGLHQDTTVINWSTYNRSASLKFFSDKNFRQMIALYYNDTKLDATKAWLDTLKTADQAGSVKGVDGFMYTAWVDVADPSQGDRYADLKRVTDLIRTQYGQYWPKEKTSAQPAQ